MHPFFFGSSDRALFGVYEPPAGRDVGRGAVICGPTGDEYYNAHRACRALANRISARGAHVLRFDYLGTGDSAGEIEDVTPGDWIANVGQAIQELKDMTGLRQIALVGLRAGAFLAARAAQGRDDVASLILWDPLSTTEEGVPAEVQPLSAGSASEDGEELSPRAYDGNPLSTLVVLTSQDEAGNHRPEEDVAGSGTGPRVIRCLGPRAWRESAAFGGGGLPTEALNEITRWIIENR